MRAARSAISRCTSRLRSWAWLAPVALTAMSATPPARGQAVLAGANAMAVTISLDFYHRIAEKRTDNNLGSKQVGPR